MSLGNVLASAYKPEPGKKVTFLRDEDFDLFGRLVTESFEVQVGLHELLGHGSGKNFMGESSIVGVADPLQTTGASVTSYYADGETWDSKFSEIASTYEECRAECVSDGAHMSRPGHCQHAHCTRRVGVENCGHWWIRVWVLGCSVEIVASDLAMGV